MKAKTVYKTCTFLLDLNEHQILKGEMIGSLVNVSYITLKNVENQVLKENK